MGLLQYYDTPNNCKICLLVKNGSAYSMGRWYAILRMQGIDHTIKNTFKRSLCSEYLERMAAPVDIESASILFELWTDCIACASSSNILKTWAESPFWNIK